MSSTQGRRQGKILGGAKSVGKILAANFVFLLAKLQAKQRPTSGGQGADDDKKHFLPANFFLIAKSTTIGGEIFEKQ